MNKAISIIAEFFGKNRIFENFPLSGITSYRVGGPADFLIKALNTDELSRIAGICQEAEMRYMVIGGGTNVLFSDSGFRGLVIKNESSEIKIRALKGILKGQVGQAQSQKVYIECDSGVFVNRLVRYCMDQGFGGLEYFSGQPGTVGGALWINAHNMKYSQFIGERVYSCKILSGNGILEKEASYFRFGYDTSLFQDEEMVLLSSVFVLQRQDSRSLWEKADEVGNHRKSTQPYGIPSAGCVFRNISKADAVRLATPEFTTSAGYLLDQAGMKGKSCGGAYFSDRHANFILCKKGAMASDIMSLIRLAKENVRNKFGLDLECEIRIIGD